MPPSGFPVYASVVVDRHGQHQKKTNAFYVRIGNSTREIADQAERQRFITNRWGRRKA